jgi:division protein CdvB (Snf7/Vps24/ESCRT-III family)
MEVKRMEDSSMRWLYEAMTTPEERARHEAEREYKKKQRVRVRLYRELAKLGLTRVEVDESRRRIEEVMRQGTQ